MKLDQELLKDLLSKCEIQIIFSGFPNRPENMIESTCYSALQKIKAVLEDSERSDSECFYEIEEIISIFEDFGVSYGNRHDFG